MSIINKMHEKNNFHIKLWINEGEKTEQKSKKNPNKISMEGLRDALYNKNFDFNTIGKVMKQKQEQNKILGKMQKNQSDRIHKLNERFKSLKEEIVNYSKDNKQILSQFIGDDQQLNSILSGKVSDVLNSMDNKDVSKKLQNVIDNTNDDNSKSVLKGLSDLYTDLYGTRDEAKQYLTESQKKIDEMKKQMETYGKHMVELEELKKKNGISDKNSESENNSNKTKVKSSNNKGHDKNSLDVLEKPEDKEKKYKTIEEMYKEDKKELRKEEKETVSSTLSKMRAEGMSNEDISEKIMEKFTKLDLKTSDNEYANGVIGDLYDGYKKYYNLKSKKQEADKIAEEGLEKFKEKINNADKVYRKKENVYTINADEYDYTEIYNPNMYNDLKSVVDSMYR